MVGNIGSLLFRYAAVIMSAAAFDSSALLPSAPEQKTTSGRSPLVAGLIEEIGLITGRCPRRR